MDVNKWTFHFILSILHSMLFLTDCTAQVKQNSNGIAKDSRLDSISPIVSNISESDSILFRFLPYEEQEKLRPSEPYHDYGKVHLTRSGGYYALRDGVREIITEIYPGVLLYKRKSGEKGSVYWKIEFYEVQSKKLIREINLEETTPYSKSKFSNIEFGLYGGQDAGHKLPPLPDSNCVYPPLPKPNKYLTNTYVNLSPTGYVCVSYELYGLLNNMFVSFENTCVIYDKKGVKMWEIATPNNIVSPYVTSDGKYFAYIYGTNTTDNFWDACRGNIEILELIKNKIIVKYEFGKDEKISTMFEAEKNGQLVVQSRNTSDGLYINRIVIIDFNSVCFFERPFKKEEWSNAKRSWVSYEQLKKQYTFYLTKF